MTKENFVSFEDYKKSLVKPIIREKYLSKDELLDKANKIQNKISQGRGE